MTLDPSKLSEKICSKKSTMTGVLKNGLVKRVALSNDKRTNYVQLTDLGLMKLKEFSPHNYEVVSKVFEVFNEGKKEEFYKHRFETYELAGALEGWKGMSLPLEDVE
ncbi:MarR family winged helix-turn-helix transcriptional regulator [Mammaliicoccus sciuri]|uniref:MarR family winged helix-turn-helix transcriptional regulator n=1 Tax=Mammaliicoccus sciuri TaxID=1296 RepID=UPI003F57843D